MKVRIRSDLETMVGSKHYRRTVGSWLSSFSPEQMYTVYGIVIDDRDGNFYLISDDGSDDYPIPYPVDLFEIIDDRPSQYWEEKNVESEHSFLFHEWSINPMFFEYLFEGWGGVELFAKYRRMMDDEFRNEKLRGALSKHHARTMAFDEGEIFIKDLKEIYGEESDNILNDWVWKSTAEPIRAIATFPNTNGVLLFFNSDVDSRVYLLDSLKNLEEIMSVCPTTPFSLSDANKDFLLYFDGDSFVSGNGLALDWDFWDEWA